MIIQLSDLLYRSTSILNVVQNYRCAYGLNETGFFLTSLTSMGHFGNNSATYCQATNSSTKSSLFLVIVGASSTFTYNHRFYSLACYLRRLKCNKRFPMRYLNESC